MTPMTQVTQTNQITHMVSAAPTAPADQTAARDSPHPQPVVPNAATPAMARTGAGQHRAQRSAMEQCPWLSRYRRRSSRGRVYLALKRAFDVAVVIAAVPVWVPLYAAAAMAVRFTSPGAPIHFTQLRTGFGGSRFGILKIRTMVPDAEERKASLAYLNEREWPDFKITKDPRVTTVGRLLRASSLDELPQLINVLLGQMSLVGPRPTSTPPQSYLPWQMERFDTRAGLTGLWQVAGRDGDSFVERLRLDLAYCQRQCLLLDLEILARTVAAVLTRRGAC